VHSIESAVRSPTSFAEAAVGRAALGVIQSETISLDVVRRPLGPPHQHNPRRLLLLIAHVVRHRRRGAAAVVVTAGAMRLGGDAHRPRFLLAHVMGDFGLRPALIVMAVLFGVGPGLRYLGCRDKGKSRRSSKDCSNSHVRCHICFSMVTLGRRDVRLRACVDLIWIIQMSDGAHLRCEKFHIPSRSVPIGSRAPGHLGRSHV